MKRISTLVAYDIQKSEKFVHVNATRFWPTNQEYKGKKFNQPDFT